MSVFISHSLMAIALLLGSHTSAAATAESPSASLSPFEGETQLAAYVETLAGERRRQDEADEAERAAERAQREAQLAEARRVRQELEQGILTGTTKPGARVEVTGTSRVFRRKSRADAKGAYRLVGLPMGTYTVTTDGTTQAFVIGRARASRLLKLDEAATKQEAIDIADVSQVNSLSVVAAEQIARLPLSRSADAIALLAPGAVSSDAITNVQTAGVDEGGIVKKAGDFLVVLRRGRLFSIRATGRILQPVASANAYGTAETPEYAWFDELLISGRTIVVIGYSYEYNATHVGLFDLSPDGRIAHRATYHLTSSDYYSSQNSASRLIGRTLLFYSPIDLFSFGESVPTFPGMRRWTGKDAPFERIAAAEHVYRSRVGEESLDQTLHTVTRCELGDASMSCRSTSVIGPGSSSFYVSGEAVYVWMVRSRFEDTGVPANGEASLVRMPLDGTVPSALRVQGSPINQLSFLEEGGYLNVLVGAHAKGLRMWSSEGRSGALALMRVRIREFGDAATWSRPEHYRALPSGRARFSQLQNRYIGDWLLYGGSDPAGVAFALRVSGQASPVELDLGHKVERIEAMGGDALIVGSANGDLQLSSVALGHQARFDSRVVLPGMSQGEQRSHGFFYKPWLERQGLFGLPVLRGESGSESASVAFLRNSNLRLERAGNLSATTTAGQDDEADGCVASCEDWYGDARPIFIGDRIYGLMGYEVVEGAMVNGLVRERRRVNFMPTPKQR